MGTLALAAPQNKAMRWAPRLLAVVAARAHPTWIAAISGPLLLVGALYAWNARHRSRPA